MNRIFQRADYRLEFIERVVVNGEDEDFHIDDDTRTIYLRSTMDFDQLAECVAVVTRHLVGD